MRDLLEQVCQEHDAKVKEQALNEEEEEADEQGQGVSDEGSNTDIDEEGSLEQAVVRSGQRVLRVRRISGEDLVLTKHPMNIKLKPRRRTASPLVPKN